MCQTVLVKEQLDAASAFLEVFSQHVPVDVAFWMREAESTSWYLHVATCVVDEQGSREPYGEVVRIVGVRNYWLDVFRIKLISPSVRTAQKAKEIRDLYDLKVPTRLNRDSLGETPVDGAYIYPPLPAHATSAS